MVLQSCKIVRFCHHGIIMVNIFDVARRILDTMGEMSPEKLHALCYYAQGWHLAMHGTPLFQEDFVKCENFDWQQGSVEESQSGKPGEGHGQESPQVGQQTHPLD
jgi:hypothetical protein